MLRILFVCTGNTCRSPMAEGLCRGFLGHFPLQQEVEVDSAGLSAVDGGPASREAIAIMQERGIDLSAHKTAGLTAEKVQWAGLILTMEEHHKKCLLERFPDAAGKAFVLKEYVEECGAQMGTDRVGKKRPGSYDIVDPFGQSTEVYRRCANELASAVADVCIDIDRRLKQEERRD